MAFFLSGSVRMSRELRPDVEGAAPPLLPLPSSSMMARPPATASAAAAPPTNGNCDENRPGVRPSRPPPVGARPVNGINPSSLPPPLPPPGSLTNGGRHSRSSVSPPSQFQVNQKLIVNNFEVLVTFKLNSSVFRSFKFHV